MAELSNESLLVSGAGDIIEGQNARLIAPLEGEAAYATETSLRQWAEDHGSALLSPDDEGLQLSELTGYRIVDLSSGAVFEVEAEWMVVPDAGFEDAVGSFEDPEGALAYAFDAGTGMPVAPAEATGLERMPSQPVGALD